MSKYPKCECNTKKFDYFRKRYRNKTLHLMRQCPQCGKVAINPMRQDEYDRDMGGRLAGNGKRYHETDSPIASRYDHGETSQPY